MRSHGTDSPYRGYDTLCKFCEGILLAPTTRPIGWTVEEWHSTAKCVEGNEPSYRMGGPA